VDPCQTAFLPGRRIGDNVLQHLEIIDYCRAEQQPGCVLFLDFEKAYDRMDRGWLMLCLQRMGFLPAAQRWVRLMLADTKAGVLYHGYLSPWFDVLSGAAQGSPLFPMLYILAVQPLAARLRHLQQDSGRIDGVQLPDGSLAPPCHQHAETHPYIQRRCRRQRWQSRRQRCPLLPPPVRCCRCPSALACCWAPTQPAPQLAWSPALA
jgi:hypothetical protein